MSKKTYETLNYKMVCDYYHFVLITAPGKPKAGKYGDYQCDIPAITFESMLQHISSTHQVQIYGVLISVLSFCWDVHCRHAVNNCFLFVERRL